MSLFRTGEIVATPASLAACERNAVNPLMLIGRHIGGDWGDLDEEDVKANVHAIQHDDRILSCYKFNGDKLYVITEWDRSYTTIMLASEY